MKTTEEIEKILNEEFDWLCLLNSDWDNVTYRIKEVFFEEMLPEVLKSVLPEWNKQTYISTYKNYIKPKVKELYNINL